MSATVNDCRANGSGFVGYGCVARRHLALLNRPERTAGHAIEDVEETGLAGHRDCIDPPSAVPDRHELWRGADVVVPQVVMDRLVIPAKLARFRIDREHAVAEQIGPFAVAAVEIIGG
jgi:hypothetical protein